MITYVYGSPLSERSLERVKLQWASAAFLVPARNPHDTAEEADKITLRSLAFDNYAPNTPLFVYNILPDSYSLQEKITDAAICLDSLKQMLLAYNCIYRGTATIVINLLRQTSARDAYDEPWQSQYGNYLLALSIGSSVIKGIKQEMVSEAKYSHQRWTPCL